jgi:hypothetical protein
MKFYVSLPQCTDKRYKIGCGPAQAVRTPNHKRVPCLQGLETLVQTGALHSGPADLVCVDCIASGRFEFADLQIEELTRRTVLSKPPTSGITMGAKMVAPAPTIRPFPMFPEPRLMLPMRINASSSDHKVIQYFVRFMLVTYW